MTMLRTERHLEDALFAKWRELREAGRLDHVLPRCVTRQWRADDGVRGYETVDYRAVRQLTLPGVWGEGDGRTDLVEFYWAVRTLEGAQHPTWLPSFNANVIELKNERLDTSHLEQTYRYVLALRSALFHGGLGELVRADKINVYVRGLLIGPEIPESVAFVDALATWSDVPLMVARYHVSATEGILFERTGSEERFWGLGYHPERLESVGKTILTNDLLLREKGVWNGLNISPVYDYRVGRPTPVPARDQPAPNER